MPAHRRPASPARLALALALLAAPLAAGCVDPPPTLHRPDRLVASETGWGPLAAPPTGGPGEVRWGAAWEAVDGPSASGLAIDSLVLSHTRLVGAERFFATVTVVAPRGEHFTAYGLKTPYEEGIHAFADLPMAMPDGFVRIRVDPLSTMPVTGRYPLEFWLINDRQEASNRLAGEIVVQ